MIIYQDSKKNFNDHVRDGLIVKKIEEGFAKNGLHDDNPKEIQSWRSSLKFVRDVLDGSTVPDDVQVAIEYRIPMAQSRIDFMMFRTLKNATPPMRKSKAPKIRKAA